MCIRQRSPSLVITTELLSLGLVPRRRHGRVCDTSGLEDETSEGRRGMDLRRDGPTYSTL
jgi:hypothetical protein